MSVVIVNVTFQVADSILILAYIGFLGFGLQFPATSWGDMLGGAQYYVTEGYWWLVYPVGGLPRRASCSRPTWSATRSATPSTCG